MISEIALVSVWIIRVLLAINQHPDIAEIYVKVVLLIHDIVYILTY